MTSPDYIPHALAQGCPDHPTLPVTDRRGATHCFNCIITETQAQAYRLACRILDDRVLAEDAVQESLLSAYYAFSQFRGDNLRGWLMRIVTNACRDMQRAARSRPTVPLDVGQGDEADGGSLAPADSFPSDTESPEDSALRGELRKTIEDGLASLSEERRIAILLVDVEGFSYEEAASAMGCSVGTVKSRINRGRRDLRDYLRNTGELLPSRFRLQ